MIFQKKMWVKNIYLDLNQVRSLYKTRYYQTRGGKYIEKMIRIKNVLLIRISWIQQKAHKTPETTIVNPSSVHFCQETSMVLRNFKFTHFDKRDSLKDRNEAIIFDLFRFYRLSIIRFIFKWT